MPSSTLWQPQRHYITTTCRKLVLPASLRFQELGHSSADGFGAWEDLCLEFLQIRIRRKEHEAAADADGDAYHSSFGFN